MTLAGCAGGWGSVIDALGMTPEAGTQSPDPFGNFTPMVGAGIPTFAPPARIGVEVVAGSMAMKVTQVVRPADPIVNRARSRPVPEANEEFVRVDISFGASPVQATRAMSRSLTLGSPLPQAATTPPNSPRRFPGCVASSREVEFPRENRWPGPSFSSCRATKSVSVGVPSHVPASREPCVLHPGALAGFQLPASGRRPRSCRESPLTHDQETCLRSISPLFDESESQDGQAPKPWRVQDPRRGGEARESDSFPQASPRLNRSYPMLT